MPDYAVKVIVKSTLSQVFEVEAKNEKEALSIIKETLPELYCDLEVDDNDVQVIDIKIVDIDELYAEDDEDYVDDEEVD